MFKKLRDIIASDNDVDNETLRLLSLACLILSGAMSFTKYTQIGWFWDSELTFQPQLISTVIAIFLISPLYLRGILKWNKSIYTLLSLILILLIFSSFTELALGGNEKSTVVILLISSSLLLSWVGIKEIAGVSWLLALSAGLYSIIINNIAMGFAGFIYITFGFIGLVLHSGLNPGQLVNGIKNAYSSTASPMNSAIKKDVTATVERSHNK